MKCVGIEFSTQRSQRLRWILDSEFMRLRFILGSCISNREVVMQGKLLFNSFSYYHLTLKAGSTQHSMGLVSKVQVGDILDSDKRDEFPNWIRFWDGETMRELLGTTTVSDEGDRISISMGQGKSYDLRKLGSSG